MLIVVGKGFNPFVMWFLNWSSISIWSVWWHVAPSATWLHNNRFIACDANYSTSVLLIRPFFSQGSHDRCSYTSKMYTFLHFQQEVYVIEARVEEGKCFVILILFLKFLIYPLKILLKADKSSNFFKNMVSELIQNAWKTLQIWSLLMVTFLLFTYLLIIYILSLLTVDIFRSSVLPVANVRNVSFS